MKVIAVLFIAALLSGGTVGCANDGYGYRDHGGFGYYDGRYEGRDRYRQDGRYRDRDHYRDHRRYQDRRDHDWGDRRDH